MSDNLTEKAIRERLAVLERIDAIQPAELQAITQYYRMMVHGVKIQDMLGVATSETAEDAATKVAQEIGRTIAIATVRNTTPWYAIAEQVQTFARVAAKTTVYQHTKQLKEHMVASNATPDDIITCTLLHSSRPADFAFYRALMVQKHGDERVLFHNFWVAMQIGQSFLLQHGPLLAKMKFPLFPPTDEFGQVNTKLMRQLTDAGTEGGDPGFVPNVYYAPPPPSRRKDRQAPTGAGYFVPYTTNEHGQTGSDLSEVQRDFHAMRDELTALRNEVAVLRGQRSPPRGRDNAYAERDQGYAGRDQGYNRGRGNGGYAPRPQQGRAAAQQGQRRTGSRTRGGDAAEEERNFC